MATSNLGCVYENGLCISLSEKSKINRLDERDMSLTVSVATYLMPGIDLNTVVFDRYGYVMNSTSIFAQILDVGIRRVYLDIFYDTVADDWHLCPERPQKHFNLTNVNNTFTFIDDETNTYVTCDYQLSLNMILNTISDYLELSDTTVAASMLYLHFRPKLWDPPTYNYTVDPSSSYDLNATIMDALINRLLTPSLLEGYQASKKATTVAGAAVDLPKNMQWPTLDACIYTHMKRIVCAYDNELANQISDIAQLGTIAFPYSSTIFNSDLFSIDDLSRMDFVDTFVESPYDWHAAVQAGVAPVYNSSVDVFGDEFRDMIETLAFWAWAPGEPILYSMEQRESMIEDGYSGDAQFDACAVVTSSGLVVADCNSHFPVLCQNKSDSYDWKVSGNNETYFDASCPKNYYFSVPANALEMRYVKEMIRKNNVSVAWVDFNSLFLPNCWVSGGVEAICPYNVYEYDRNGVGFICVAGAICLVFAVVIILFEWDRGRSPLVNKRLFRDKRAREYEGVPS